MTSPRTRPSSHPQSLLSPAAPPRACGCPLSFARPLADEKEPWACVHCGVISVFERIVGEFDPQSQRGSQETLGYRAVELDEAGVAWVSAWGRRVSGEFTGPGPESTHFYLRAQTRFRLPFMLDLAEKRAINRQKGAPVTARLLSGGTPALGKEIPESVHAEAALRAIVRLHGILAIASKSSVSASDLSDLLRAADEGATLPRAVAQETLLEGSVALFPLACALLEDPDGPTRGRAFSHLLETALAIPPWVSTTPGANAEPLSELPDNFGAFRRRLQVHLDEPERSGVVPPSLLRYLASELASLAQDPEQWPHAANVLLGVAALGSQAFPLLPRLHAFAAAGGGPGTPLLVAQLRAAAIRIVSNLRARTAT